MSKPIYHIKAELQRTDGTSKGTAMIVASGNDDAEIRQSILDKSPITVNGAKWHNYKVISYQILVEVKGIS